jgi:hypothetical protein
LTTLAAAAIEDEAETLNEAMRTAAAETAAVELAAIETTPMA